MGEQDDLAEVKDASPVLLDEQGHLWCKDVGTLHEFAKKLGMKNEWFQKGRHHSNRHYDVWGSKRVAAIKAGAMVITSRELLRRIKEERADGRK